jgi:hypothetical protein
MGVRSNSTAEQSLAADGAIAFFSSSLILRGLNGDRALQLKAGVIRFRFFEGVVNVMKRLPIALLAVGCIAFYSQPTQACYCVVPEFSESFKLARAVFLGEATDIVEPKTSNENAPLAERAYTIKFKVLQSWKGVPLGTGEFSILWLTNCYECPALPSLNERYLVYANPPISGNETWSLVTWCSRTMVVRRDPKTRAINSNGIDPYRI